jgi:hypothetical protein
MFTPSGVGNVVDNTPAGLQYRKISGVDDACGMRHHFFFVSFLNFHCEAGLWFARPLRWTAHER